MIDTKAIIRRHASLKQARQPHESGWKECFDFSFPERSHGLDGSTVLASDVQSKKSRILDDTASDAARTLGSAIVSGTTPASSIWFGLGVGADDDDDNNHAEGLWLDNCARTIFDNIHGSNFDAVSYECAIDLVPSGWFVMYIDEAENGGYYFEQWPIAQCYVSSSRLGGLVDTIHREVEMTVEQVVALYGIDAVSEKTRKAYEDDKLDQKVNVLHAIYPRRLSVSGARMAKNLPFASMHIELGSAEGHLLKESGYHEFPCVVPRWMLVPGTAYPTGPMSQALGSIRTVNDIKAMELMNLDMAAAGMYVAEDDGVFNPRSVKIGPRKILVANSVDSIKPLAPAGQFDVTFTAEERLQSSIRKILLADQLQPQDGPAMTATEVHVRVQLIRQLLGPIYGRLQAEYLQPLIARCFGLAYRAGVLGQAPESLQGVSTNVKYISPLARAQRLEDVTAMDRFENTLAMEAQIDQGVLDLYDFEAAARFRADFLGVPKPTIRSPEAIIELRKTRQEAQKQQQQQSMQQQAAQDAAGAMITKAAA
jgi:hypothetical protein